MAICYQTVTQSARSRDQPIVIFRKPTLSNSTKQPADSCPIDKFDFLGVWDTVDAYGGPIEEMYARDRLLVLAAVDAGSVHEREGRTGHAMRWRWRTSAMRFSPVLWDDRYVQGQRSCLFRWIMAGHRQPAENGQLAAYRLMNASARCGLSAFTPTLAAAIRRTVLPISTLAWMIERAKVYGSRYCLPFQEELLKRLRRSAIDKLNDFRHGLAGYYRYGRGNCRISTTGLLTSCQLVADFWRIVDIWKNRPDPEREVRRVTCKSLTTMFREADAEIHRSVLDRVRAGTDGYVPIVLPQTYDVVGYDGSITSNGVTATTAPSRATRQEKVWNWVWGRRITYFLTVFASLFVLALPLIEKWKPGRGPASPAEVVVPIIDLVGAFLPSFVKPWLEAFRNSPGRFLIGLVLVGVLMYVGGWMQGHIRDLMR